MGAGSSAVSRGGVGASSTAAKASCGGLSGAAVTAGDGAALAGASSGRGGRISSQPASSERSIQRDSITITSPFSSRSLAPEPLIVAAAAASLDCLSRENRPASDRSPAPTFSTTGNGCSPIIATWMSSVAGFSLDRVRHLTAGPPARLHERPGCGPRKMLVHQRP